MLGTFGALWGLAGVSLLLGSAVCRLSPLAADIFSGELLWYHWISLIGIVVFMAYAEGYRGFQQRFSPRVAARAKYLKQHPRPLHVLLAPFFCMGYFHASKKRQITSISLTAGIIVLVLLVRLLAQPWRGIIDAGVVVGLVWGLVSLLGFSAKALAADNFACPPEIPEEES